MVATKGMVKTKRTLFLIDVYHCVNVDDRKQVVNGELYVYYVVVLYLIKGYNQDVL